jgi:glycosyltransferase involved in cell wall biosynthesis
MRILFLSGWYPYPPDNGSKLRIYNLIRGIAKVHELTLVSVVDPSTDIPESTALQPFCKEMKVLPQKVFNANSMKARLGYFRPTPRSIVASYSTELENTIRETLGSGDFDLVIASEWGMAAYVNAFRGYKALLEDLELGVLYEAYARADALWTRLRSGLTWIKHRRYLRRLLPCFQACTVVSEPDRKMLCAAIPEYKNMIEVIPNCIDGSDYIGYGNSARPNSLIYTGSFRYGPNYDAMIWFIKEIFPAILARNPAVHLTITGDRADRSLPPGSAVTHAGFVRDVKSLIAGSAITIVPLRIGAGTRLKILEAMALGTPVVSTSKGAEGLEVQHGEHLLIADDPGDFSDAVLRLLHDPELSSHLAVRGSKLVREKYEWEQNMPRLLNLIERVVHS